MAKAARNHIHLPAALALLATLLLSSACAATSQPATQEKADPSSVSQEAQMSQGEDDSVAASGTSSSQAASPEAAPGSEASANANANASSTSASTPAIGLISSPELLRQRERSSSSSSVPPDAVLAATPENGYNGALIADGDFVEQYGQTIESSVPDQSVLLAQNGGMLLFNGGTLNKLGDSPDDPDSAAYGLNSIALSVGEGSSILLASAIAQTASLGSCGLFSADFGRIYANDITFTAASNNAKALVATRGGQVLGNGLTATTSGNGSASVATGTEEGAISLANCLLETKGSLSPLIQGGGRAEVDNTVGTAEASALATVRDAGVVLIHGSRLCSTAEKLPDTTQGDYGVLLYSESEDGKQADTEDPSLSTSPVFQADNSTLSSSIQDGALFRLTNTRAKVVLSNTRLDFDSTKARLLVAAGDEAGNWGSTGNNGANATFTARRQTLKGSVAVDSISTVDMYLLDQSHWEGTASITANNKGIAAAENLNVSIDSTSTWVVTSRATVTNLNLANGGKLVDEKGLSVKLVDQNGLTLVDGASDVSVVVMGNFSTNVKTSAANELEPSTIDRTEFDEVFGVSTPFGQNGSSAYTEDEQRVAGLEERVRAWFAAL